MRIFVLVLMHIHLQSHAHLAQVVLAGGGVGAVLGLRENREEQCGQNSNDGDDHKHLDQRESDFFAIIWFHTDVDSPQGGDSRCRLQVFGFSFAA